MKLKIEDLLMKILWILSFLMLFFTVLKNNKIVSYSFLLSILITYILFFIIVIKRIKFKSYFVLIGLIILVSSFSVMNLEISYIYLRKYLLFVTVLIFFLVSKIVKVSEKTINLIYKINFAISIVYIYYAYYKNTNYIANALTLNFENPNKTGLFLFASGVYILLYFYSIKKYKFRLILIITLVLLFDILLKTDARSSLIALIIFIFISSNKKLIKIIINKVTISLLIILPILFPILYVCLYKINFYTNKLFFGKVLYTGRELYWIDFFNQGINLFFKGNYLDYDGKNFQLFNMYIDLIESYGYLTFIIVIIFLSRILFNTYNNIENYRSLIGFLCLFIIGMVESAVLSGSLCFHIYIGTLLIISTKNQMSKN